MLPDIGTSIWPLASVPFLLLFMVVVWFVFLRPVVRRTATGVITEKTFKPAGETYQYPEGNRPPTRIPIAECYVFTVSVNGKPFTAAYSLNTTAAEQFEVGQHVEITYEVRGLPLIWMVACILEMKPASEQRDSTSV